MVSRDLDYVGMRLFVGIPLEGFVVDELIRLTEPLRSTGELRWSAPESWHITLQFLGSTGTDQYDCLVSQLEKVRGVPVPVQLRGLAVFERTGILYAEVEPRSPLADLQKKVVRNTSLCGFEPETRPYRPHITLARSKGGGPFHGSPVLAARVKSLAEVSGFTAREFLLYESHLSSAGSNYVTRRRFPFAETP